MKRQLGSVLIPVFLVAASAPGLAPAQSNEAADDTGAKNVMEEIRVTAQKREESLEDVPIAITVVTGEQLAAQRIYSIADLARTSPSLEMIQAFGGPGGGGQIRGIGTQSFSQTAEGAVGIVVDDVPQGNVPMNAMFDLGQVEVLRGPQGTLFGLTASAGVINMRTVAPDPTAFSGYAQVDWSDGDSLSSEFGQKLLRGAINMPLGEQSALRVAVNGLRQEGVEYNAGTGEDDVLKDRAIRARYLWEGDGFTLNLMADYDKRDQNYFDPRFVYVKIPEHTPLADQMAACGIVASWANNAYCSAFPDYQQYSKSKNYGFSGRLDWDLAGGTLTSITAYRKNEVSPSSFDIMGNPQEFVQIFNIDNIGSGRQWSQEFRFASAAGEDLEYVTGFFYSDFEGTSGYAPGGRFTVGTFQLAPFFIPFVITASDSKTTNKAWALFGQLTYHLNDRMAVIAGLRYTDQKLTTGSGPNIYDPTSVATHGKTTESNVSGKVGLQYALSDQANLYATFTRGYKGPQVIPAQLGEDATVVGAEIPTAYELGTKGSLLEGQLGFDVSLFYTDVKDYQGQRCRVNSVGVLACNGESISSVTTKGIEVDLFGEPVDGLYLNGGVIYNVAELPDGWTGFNPHDLRDPVPGTLIGQTDMSGLQLVGVPKFKFVLNGEYTFPIGGFNGFIGGDAVYKDDLRLGYTSDNDYVYPSHWILSARVGLRTEDERWTVELFGRNLGNEHEPVNLFGGPSFLPPGVVPFLPNGAINGISGWYAPTSLREVGLSASFHW